MDNIEKTNKPINYSSSASFINPPQLTMLKCVRTGIHIHHPLMYVWKLEVKRVRCEPTDQD